VELSRLPASSANNVIDLLQVARERVPDKPVLIFEDGLQVTRQELANLVEGFAGKLAGTLQPGDRAAIIMDNRAEFMIASLAVIAHRAAYVPVNPASGRVDGLGVLRASRATVAIVDGSSKALLDSWRPELPDLREVFVVGDEEPTGLPTGGGKLDLRSAACQPDDIIAIPFTSGTTGIPKGCMTDHVRILRSTDVAMRVHAHSPEDRFFCPVQFFYLDAFSWLVRALRCDAVFIAVRKFSVSRFWDVVRTQRVTMLSTIATMPVWLLKAEPTSRDREHNVRFAVHAHVPRELHEELDRRWGFPWMENYGMMEAGLIARVPLELAAELRGSGSAGPVVDDRVVRIVDDNDDPVPTGSVGEIITQGPGMFRGYLDSPEATDQILRNGWLHTGDLGRLDERGLLFVVGRKKDVVRRSGVNVSPEEVEEVLRACPGILDAAVVGVPDVDRGEELEAHLLLKDQKRAVAPEDIVKFCEGTLAPHKIPRYFRFVTELPLNASMRVRKEALRMGAVHPGSWDRAKGEWVKA
jgi:crotonobetaine/carnitine-CoA ligase